jgi:type I restriction enzyme S subunit
MSWRRVPLRRIFRLVNGGTPTSDEKNWDGDVPWATPVDIGNANGSYLAATQRNLSDEGVRTGSRTVPGKSLLTSIRAPIGYVAQTTREMAFNQGCRGLVPVVETDPRYFRYQLLTQRKELSSRGAGSTFMELSTDGLATVPVLCPPFDEQRRIADFLDAEVARIDQLSDLQIRSHKVLMSRDRTIRDNLVDQLAEQVGELPLRRSSGRIEQGTSPGCLNHARDDGKWAVIKLSAVKNGVFFPQENKQLPDEVEPSRQYELRDGDLLVSRANTPDLVGDVAVVCDAGSKLLLPDLIYRVALNKAIRADFVAQVLLSSRVRNLITAAARGSSQSMVKLRGEDIREWPLPRASERQQADFVAAIDNNLGASARLRTAIDRQLALLAERRQALITAAVTGEVDVTTARGLSPSGG